MKNFHRRGAEDAEKQEEKAIPWRHSSLTAQEWKLRYNPQRDFDE
jgi:hypothetical protein